MKKETKTIAQQLGIKDFPFTIKDDNGNIIYAENSDDFWCKYEYDSNGNRIYLENYKGFWWKKEFNENNIEIYFENSNGYWTKKEYDFNNNEIYYENSDGVIKDYRPKVVELSIEEIAKKLGIDSKNLKIVDK